MSLHYYAENEDDDKEESINKYLDLFIEYIGNPPNLSDALKQMFINSGLTEENSNEYIKDIISKTQEIINKNLEAIKAKYPTITIEDIQIISSYTCEAKDKNFNPYKLLNKNLVSENRKQGIQRISKYLFIFLKSLRKLDRYYLNENSKYLYRSIGSKVTIDKQTFNQKLVPYIAGNSKTFWGFTSTSPNIKTAYDFLNGNSYKTGTVFTLYGEVWGYDITVFNYYKENEVLLEPERKFKVDEVLPPLNEIIYVRCEIKDSPLVLIDILKSNYIKIKGNSSINQDNTIERRKNFIQNVFEGMGEKTSGNLEEDWDTLINYIPSKYCLIRGCSGKFITIKFKKANDTIDLTVPEDAKLKDVFIEYIKEQKLNDVNTYCFLCNGEKLENNSEVKLMERNIQDKSVITVVDVNRL